MQTKTVFKIKIKSAITPFVWYTEKIGEVYEGEKHYTESLFWFPGNVFKTPYGYIHALDAEVLDYRESLVEPIQSN